MSQIQSLSAGGKISGDTVQVQSVSSNAFVSTTAVIPGDDSLPQIGEGALLLTLPITPTKSTNRLVFEFACFSAPSAAENVTVALFEGAGPSAIFATLLYQHGANFYQQPNFVYSKIAGSTSALTYTVRYGGNAGALIAINGATVGRRLGGAASVNLVITEYEV